MATDDRKQNKPINLKSLVIPGAYLNAHLKHVEFTVLVHLAAHANFTDSRKAGEAWPSIGRLSALTGISRRAVQYSIEKLVKAGFVEIKRMGGGRKATVYLLPHIATMVDEKNNEPESPATKSNVTPISAVATQQKQPEFITVNNKQHAIVEIISTLVLRMKRMGQCRNESGLRRSLKARYKSYGAVCRGELVTEHGDLGEALDITQAVAGSSPGLLRPR